MTDSVVVEGYARLRDGKKWKTRWLVLRKPSPVADCLVLQVFKDKTDKAQGSKERASVTLEEICGLETGQWYESVAFTLSILCLNQAALLGFDSREALQAWEVRLRYSLGEVHRFSVGVLPGTKLESGPATLHLCNNLLALARDIPPSIVGHWNLPDLRRYGPVPNGFVFEGGTRCGYWAGVFLLTSAESEHISFLFDCIVRGISPTRGPFGLRPVLPDPNASQTNSEERLNHETQELEKRLSMLSHRSSTVSSVYCPSPGGDDQSISGSSDTSDTSQSDGSIGSRLVIWSEPSTNQPESSGPVGIKVTSQSVEKLSVNHGVGTRTLIKAPRQLQEIGRQSSSDSGIATGSHSSYSGSFSSYTSSVDITPAEDFGSVFSLPPHLAQDLSPCTCPTIPGHEYQVPSSLRYLYDSPKSLVQEAGGAPKECENSHEECATAASTETSQSLSENIRQSVSGQVPTEWRKAKMAPSSDRVHPEARSGCSSVTSVPKTIITICSVCGGFKATPFIPASSLVVPAVPADQSVDTWPCRKLTGIPDNSAVIRATPGSVLSTGKVNKETLLPKKLAALLADLLHYPRVDREPEVNICKLDLYESMSLTSAKVSPSSPVREHHRDRSPVIYENCLKCLGAQCQPLPRVLPDHVLHNRGNFSSNVNFNSLHHNANQEQDAHKPAYYKAPGLHSHSVGIQWEEMNCLEETREDKRLCIKEERFRADHAYEIMESPVPERNSEGEEKSKYELMGRCGQQRFLQDTEGKSSTKYAQIDITATETAHKVGTQHALGRQEGLHALELRRRTTQH
ncbi:protein Dok-7-like [Neosynchiropus ocellatus]